MLRYVCVIHFILIVHLGGMELHAQVGTEAYAYNVSIDLVNVSPDKDRVKVTIFPPAVKGPKVTYVLPKYLPGVNSAVNAGRFVHQFYALDDKGFPLKVKKKGDNMIVMKLRKGCCLKKIEYWVDDTWDMEKLKEKISDEKFNYVEQSAGTNFESGNNFLLNHAFLFGYLDGLANIPYHLTITKPDELIASSALRITHATKTRDEYSTTTYFDLIDSPVLYCRPDTIGFQSGNIRIIISVYSENSKVTSRLVRRMIASEVTACTNFLGEVPHQSYTMLFYFTTPFKTILNQYGNYSGLEHKHSSFYFLPELVDEDQLSSELNRVTSGDVLHTLSPLDHLSFCGKGDLLQPQINSNCWFSEGANLYLGWLASVRDSFVSENEFMGAVSAAIRLSTLLPNRPITDIQFVNAMAKDPLRKQALRSKAMLLSLLLDIEITKATGGNIGLREVVLNLNSSWNFSSDSLEKRIIAMTDPSVAEFFKKYVRGTAPLPLMHDLEMIGWAYAPSSIDSVLTFGKFGLYYDDMIDAFIVHNSDTNNLFRLHDGDRIVSVNGNIVGAISFEEVLQPIYSPKNEDPVILRYLRGDENISVIANPMVIAVAIDYFIKADPAAPDDAYLLHERIFHPRI